MNSGDPFPPAETPSERIARQEAYERLAEAAKRAGLPLSRLHAALSRVAHNEAETRRFLAEEVYGVPDEFLDDLVRVRLADVAEQQDRKSVV